MHGILAVWMDSSPKWVLLEIVYFIIAGALLAGAYRAKSEWGKACLGALGVSILGWRLLAVLPSWWLYFAEGNLHWGGQGCVNLDIACLKQAGKDVVVVIENAVALGGFIVAFWLYQKKFPRQLGPGEAKLEQTGGYK